MQPIGEVAMARNHTAVIATAVVLAFAYTSVGATPPPPPPIGGPNLTKESCGEVAQVVQAQATPAVVSPLTPESLGMKEGRLGKLTWKWGVRIASSDPRVHGVTGLELTGKLGLLAMTADRNWLTLDLQAGRLDRITSIGVAPMLGQVGSPVSVAEIFGSVLVSAKGSPTVDIYAPSACGVASKAVPLFTPDEGATPLVVDAADTYAGLVREEGGGLRDAIALIYRPTAVLLEASTLPTNLPSAMVAPGHHLRALSNSARSVPEIIALWTADNGDDAILQNVYVVGWSDVRGGASPVTEIARLPRTPSAMTSIYLRPASETIVYLMFETDQPGTLDVYALSLAK